MLGARDHASALRTLSSPIKLRWNLSWESRIPMLWCELEIEGFDAINLSQPKPFDGHG